MSEGSGAVSEAVAKTEQELAKSWAASVDGAAGDAKVRASTMNFVVATAPAELERLRSETVALAETRAGRVFLLTLDARLAPWELTSNVSATCHKSGDDVICHDRVEFAFGAVAAARAGSVVSALTLGEVPTIVEIARGAPASLVDSILKGADRLIVDSAITPAARLGEIASKVNVSIGDRAMVRQYSWRDLVARFFDDTPAAAKQVRALRVRRTPGAPCDPAASIVGWMASRLGWTFTSKTEARDADKKPVTIEVRDDSREGLVSGELTSIEVEAELDGKKLTGRVERDADPSAVIWTLRGARVGEHRHALGFRDETWVLQKAIDASEGDNVTRASILAAAAWSAA